MCEHYDDFKKEMKTIFGTAVQWGASSLLLHTMPQKTNKASSPPLI